MVNRGAVKLLQAFVNQLPQQDLRHGLPSHFPELANLVRQVTLLSAGAALNGEVKDRSKVKGKDNLSDVESGLMAQIAHVEVYSVLSLFFFSIKIVLSLNPSLSLSFSLTLSRSLSLPFCHFLFSYSDFSFPPFLGMRHNF